MLAFWITFFVVAAVMLRKQGKRGIAVLAVAVGIAGWVVSVGAIG